MPEQPNSSDASQEGDRCAQAPFEASPLDSALRRKYLAFCCDNPGDEQCQPLKKEPQAWSP